MGETFYFVVSVARLFSVLLLLFVARHMVSAVILNITVFTLTRNRYSLSL